MRGAEELRAKESDRIEAVVEELRRIGGHIRATRDGFRIKGVPARLRGGVVDSRGDHRLAMLGAVAGSPRAKASSCAARTPLPRASRASSRCSAQQDPLRDPVARSLPSRDMIVAIDGPAGSGKSTVASTLARRLGFRYLDTGAMYRALTWIARRDGADVADGSRSPQLALAHPVSFGEDGCVEIDGEDVTTAIRDAEIDRLVPVVARHPEVREVMRERQRALAVGRRLGHRGSRHRNASSCPDAEVKVFLLADADERARRRSRRAARGRGGRARGRPARA